MPATVAVPSPHSIVAGKMLAGSLVLGDAVQVASSLAGLAALIAEDGNPTEAARLLGAASGLRAAAGAPLAASDQEIHDRDLAATRTALEPAVFAAAWEAGAASTLDQITRIAEVLS